MNNMNYMVLNERNNPDRFYPLEKNVWLLTEHHRNTSAFVFFDSCREDITKEKMGAKSSNQLKITKDGQARGANVEVKSVSSNSHNVVSVFGCLPNHGVSLNSTLSDNVVQILTNIIIKNGGVLRMPDAFKRLSIIEK